MLARVEASEVVAAAYGGAAPMFGPEYIIPKPFDPRLILQIAPAVAAAAMRSGVARRPIADFDAYRRELERFVFRSGQLMRPVFEAAKAAPQRIVYAEGEDERVLRAVQTLVDDGIARPILLGRRSHIKARVRQMGLRLDLGGAVQILDPSADACGVRAAVVPRNIGSWWAGAACRPTPHPAACYAGPPWPRPCCCNPAMPTPPFAAASATGGGTWNTSCRSSRAGPRCRASTPCPA